MQNTGPIKKVVIRNLIVTPNSHPSKVEQALIFSKTYITSYLTEHARECQLPDKIECAVTEDVHITTSSEAAALLAAGRLEWLLEMTRPSLSKLFSLQDIATLLECFENAIFFPEQFAFLASGLCDYLGIALGDRQIRGIAPLVNKLNSLNAAQRLTLADALEQTWHGRRQPYATTPIEILASLGIELA